MNLLSMLQTSAVLLIIAAAGGLVMAGIRFSGKPHPPAWLAMLHGLLAASALTLLLYAAVTAAVPPLALYGTVLLVLAALGGLILNLAYHWQQRPLPIPLMVGHALLAAIGFVRVLIAAFAHQAA